MISASELRQSRQSIPFSRLSAIAREHGFVVERRTKHTRIYHPDFPDIFCGFGTSRDHLHKLRLADLIDALAERKAHQENRVKKSFEKAARTRLKTIQSKIPHYMEAFYGENGSIVVRDTQIPQIGFILFSPEEDRLIENKTRILDSIKRDFFILLHRCQMEFDIDVKYDKKGKFSGHLSHNVYDMEELILPPFPDEQKPTLAIEAYQKHIQEIDKKHAATKEALLNKPFILQSPLVAHSARRGERTNHVNYKIPGVTKSLRFSFSTHSNRRVRGDGSTARISETELQKLANIVNGIERKITAGSKTDQAALKIA